MVLSDAKPGVLGVVGNLGQQVTQGTTNEIKKAVENTAEQLGMKEKKEVVTKTAVSAQAQKQQSKEAVDWLYGTSEKQAAQPAIETPQVPLGIAKQKEEKKDIKEQTANPLEQMGLGKSTQQTASLSEQLPVNAAPSKTVEELQKNHQLAGTLHQEYYQKLTNPSQDVDTEQRLKKAQEEEETAQQRMERLELEDLSKKREDEKKKEPIAVVMAQNMEKNRGSSG